MDAPEDLELDPAALGERERYFLLTSVVVPRPIAWVSTLDATARATSRPTATSTPARRLPPIVHFTSTTSRDSLANVKATGEFVVNVVSEDLAQAMRISSAALYSGEDEFEVAGLETVPSHTVSPPRVAGTKVALECRLRQLLEMGEGTMVFGDVLHIHVERSVWRDGRVDPTLLRPVGRLSAPNYTTVSDVYSLELPADVKRRADDYSIRGGPAGPDDQADSIRSCPRPRSAARGRTRRTSSSPSTIGAVDDDVVLTRGQPALGGAVGERQLARGRVPGQVAGSGQAHGVLALDAQLVRARAHHHLPAPGDVHDGHLAGAARRAPRRPCAAHPVSNSTPVAAPPSQERAMGVSPRRIDSQRSCHHHDPPSALILDHPPRRRHYAAAGKAPHT